MVAFTGFRPIWMISLGASNTAMPDLQPSNAPIVFAANPYHCGSVGNLVVRKEARFVRYAGGGKQWGATKAVGANDDLVAIYLAQVVPRYR